MSSRKQTVAILIGNSDDKLSQAKWSHFVEKVYRLAQRTGEVHFCGTSGSISPFQNACVVIEISDAGERHLLHHKLRQLATDFEQDSIAIVTGRTDLVRPWQWQQVAAVDVQKNGPVYFCRCASCRAGFESSNREAVICRQCQINADWQYSQWSIDCISPMHEEGTLFNRADRY